MQRGDEEAVVTALGVFLGIQIVPLALGAIVVGPRMFGFLLKPISGSPTPSS